MIYAIAIALIVLGVITATAPLRVLQRGGYRAREYFTGLGLWEYLPVLIGATAGVLCAYGIGFSGAYWYAEFGGAAVGIAICIGAELIPEHVPPFQLTARCKRLYLALVPAEIAVAALLCGLSYATKSAAWAAFLPAIQLLLAPLAARVLAPYEKKRQAEYIDAAKDKLRRIRPIIVGVTGSYGKTSFKNALAAILSQTYRVCVSPASYNTPMGLCLTINDRLSENDRILIAEMGARYVGDIAELTAIAPPNVAVVTGIGTQHLETFGSEENLRNTKYELVEGLVSGGVAFFAEDEGSRALAERTKSGGYCADDPDSPYYVRFCDVEVTDHGSRFTIETREARVRAETRLLGAHNLANLRLACSVARYFGLEADALAKGCASAAPTPHRLQLIPGRGGLKVIDDSYNASTEGIRAATEVLSLFPRARAVITPGIVEAGQEAEVSNFRAGCLFAGVCEYAFVYGPNAKSLEKGLVAGGMAADRVIRVRGRDAAVGRLENLSDLKVVLFSNDLPH